MSSWSYDDICLKCGSKNFIAGGSNKPYDSGWGHCLDCGFEYYTEEGQLSLEEVNELRKDFDRKPIKKLRKQKDI